MGPESSKQFDPNIGKATQFKPGESGNPAGGPKGKRLTTLLQECLDIEVQATDPVTNIPTKMKMDRVQILALLREGAKGNTKALQIIFERLEGSVPNKLNLGNADGNPLIPGPISLEILSVAGATDPTAVLPGPTAAGPGDPPPVQPAPPGGANG